MDKLDMQAVLDAGAAIAKPQFLEGLSDVPLIVVPEGYKAEDLERLLQKPARHRGVVTLKDAASFIAYFKRYEVGNIYGNYNPPQFVAVFNDHSKELPGWRDHRAFYACPLSPEWKVWTEMNGKKLDQLAFAEFVENNLPDVVRPSAADFLEISRSLEATKKANFASAMRLHDGSFQFSYQEDIEGAVKKGQMKVPETFDLGIPVFEAGQKYKVEARLRYRLEGPKLVMWFDLLRPHKILEDAVKGVWDEIATGTGATILNTRTESL